MSDTILAVDLGQYKCVACAYDRRPTTTATATGPADTSPPSRTPEPAPRMSRTPGPKWP